MVVGLLMMLASGVGREAVPGDGRVTKASLLARDSLAADAPHPADPPSARIPSPPRSRDPPRAAPRFRASVHYAGAAWVDPLDQLRHI